ncbi:hypothetical protein [Streptomyces sp. NPDC050548]|uniref:hypothetical protein n=1 Tax=Streptomyces sp. NPDC050548 TaxID=3365629 RepID=UPI0037AE89B1
MASPFLIWSGERGGEAVTLPGHPRAGEPAETWEQTYGDIVVDGPLHIGELPAPEEWVLLTQWDIGLDGRQGSTLHWVVPRQDLAGRRFDRVHVSFYWNP